MQNGVDLLISLGLYVLDSAQRNYCTTSKELLAIYNVFQALSFGTSFYSADKSQ